LRSFLDAAGGSAHRYSLPIYALRKAKAVDDSKKRIIRYICAFLILEATQQEQNK